MSQSAQDKTSSSVKNRRLGLVLFTVAITFFVGIFANKVIFG